MSSFDAVAFSITEAIAAGDVDKHLGTLARAVQQRRAVLHDHENVPPETKDMIASGHQVWAWMNGPGRPHWEVRGTGVLLDDPPRRKP